MSGSLLRYNAYTGVRDAGIIRVRSVEGDFAISKLQVAKDYLLRGFAQQEQLCQVSAVSFDNRFQGVCRANALYHWAKELGTSG